MGQDLPHFYVNILSHDLNILTEMYIGWSVIALV